MKKLSLALPSAQSSTNSLLSPLAAEPPTRIADAVPTRRRRPSIISLPNASTSSILHRKDEDGDGEDSSAVPYADGTLSDVPGFSKYHTHEEEEETAGSLTKQLAETAVGVREMSKQLGES